ncbi:MAG: hypothetical protein QJR02_01885 [Sinobacteraceae bacterium]|nr:hypothetical protein [Nevskiaceae bacterium]
MNFDFSVFDYAQLHGLAGFFTWLSMNGWIVAAVLVLLFMGVMGMMSAGLEGVDSRDLWIGGGVAFCILCTAAYSIYGESRKDLLTSASGDDADRLSTFVSSVVLVSKTPGCTALLPELRKALIRNHGKLAKAAASQFSTSAKSTCSMIASARDLRATLELPEGHFHQPEASLSESDRMFLSALERRANFMQASPDDDEVGFLASFYGLDKSLEAARSAP